MSYGPLKLTDYTGTEVDNVTQIDFGNTTFPTVGISETSPGRAAVNIAPFSLGASFIPSSTTVPTDTPTAIALAVGDTTDAFVLIASGSRISLSASSDNYPSGTQMVLHVDISFQWSDTHADDRTIEIYKNGSPCPTVRRAINGGTTQQFSAHLFGIAAGDYIEVYATQSSGSDKTIAAGFVTVYVSE